MNFTQGTRISLRGEDFLIKKVENNYNNKQLLFTEGISELVKGKRFIFDTDIDKPENIQVLHPENTRLVADNDTAYRRTKLYIETVIRNSSYFSNKIEIAQKAAINPVDYQFEPTLKAFKLPRPRLLIADAVGLGKTIEVGVFLAEMIKRGKGQRILVIALKSILGQFQQEIWSRFVIPLVRLDSVGIAKIKTHLPANKNPFDYYDKSIISIDTLKNNAKFRHYIEKSRWDIVVIDECHTVANARSQRSKLAQELAKRCESLIFTSATPHNGNKESFANLIQMLEPTAIPKNGTYNKDNIEPYFIRRFKHHIENTEVQKNFKERKIIKLTCGLSQTEEHFLDYQQHLKLEALSSNRKHDLLFSINLFKSYLSSPEACLKSVNNRIKKVTDSDNSETTKREQIDILTEAQSRLNDIIQTGADAKYTKLIETLEQLKWKGKKRDERIIIFAERIETLKALKSKLTAKFGLTEASVTLFSGALSDIEQQAVIEDFGKEDSPIRLFLTSDAGSMGVNLHYYCHRMFNYDIPWSIITLDQRNGRIDRYGQKNTPFIYYLVAESEDSQLKTDLHIISKLIEKENEVHQSLGDATSVYKLYDAKEEEKLVQKALSESDESVLDQREEQADSGDEFDFLDELFAQSEPEPEPIIEVSSFYVSDFKYYQTLLTYLTAIQPNLASGIETNEIGQYIEIFQDKIDGLKAALYDIPIEAKPNKKQWYQLSANVEDVQKSIENARKKKGEWARFQVLYDLHPIIKWFMDKLLANVDKDAALVVKTDNVPANTAWYLFHGVVSNQLGQSVVSEFFVVGLKKDGRYLKHQRFAEFA
ncbi:MAG: SNF2-related protein, partial [Chitinophagales bacterium]